MSDERDQISWAYRYIQEQYGPAQYDEPEPSPTVTGLVAQHFRYHWPWYLIALTLVLIGVLTWASLSAPPPPAAVYTRIT